ncbi:MAG TPA: amidohydrolase family protein [Bryobacteraceae bacterium]|nr:amidohydrolase family protein [Bryobacteraceae bacterium]
MKKIALEEHVLVPGAEQIVPEHQTHPEFKHNMPALLDITGARIRAMDEGEIEVSVLSPTAPGLQGLSEAAVKDLGNIARRWNDYLAEAVARHQARLKVFAALPMCDPELAVGELSRAVKELGFVGALVNGYDNSGNAPARYYDSPQYADFWKTAAALDVPVYVHPRSVPDDRTTTYSGYPELRGSAWGFHVETAEHMLRLMMSGLFDKLPTLRIIIGHLGELLPLWAWRIDHRLNRERWAAWAGEQGRPRKLTVSEYLRRNFFATTSGTFDTDALKHVVSVMGSDRVLYSVDYPYESTTEASEWFEGLDLEPQVKAAIAYGNAEQLLGLRKLRGARA